MSDIKKEFTELRKEYIRKYFGRMNDRQFEGVVTANGPVLILAGAGSGKTTVLVNRIASLIRFGNAYYSDFVPPFINEDTLSRVKTIESGSGDDRIFAVDPVRPWEILAITFTNKAAGELKERISAMLGQEGLDVWAGTFHSVCSRMLRRFSSCLGYTSHFTIYDTDDQKRVMKEVYKQLQYDEKFLPVKGTLSVISRAKDQLITPAEFIRENAADVRLSHIGRAYELYQKQLFNADAMDFDDMIVNTVNMLKSSSEALEYYRNKFKYIMVDEYQDTNHAQYVLVSLLAEGSRNICVVGDDDQSIYRFRGATIENILNFESEYENAKVIRLEQNYRSTQTILDAANAVIANNTARKGKNLWTAGGEGDKITVYTAPDEQGEAAYVVDSILNGVAAGGKYSDNAILYRMNAQSNALENYLARSGVPYRVIGGNRFYDRKEIRDVIAYLNVIANHNDRVRILRIINEPKRGIGATTMANAVEISDVTGVPLFEVLKNAGDYAALSRAAAKLTAFTAVIEELSAKAGEMPLSELFREMLDRTGYMLSLLADGREGADRADNVRELESSIAQYESENEDASLSGFLEEVALVSDIDQFDSEADAVVLMTIHSAKGLEFENVFLVGMEEGIFPGSQSIYGTADDIEEERRLAYVAITRAKKKLYITNSYTRMLYGQTGRNLPSRFLEEVPGELCSVKGTGQRGGSFVSPQFRTGGVMRDGQRFGDTRPLTYAQNMFGGQSHGTSPFKERAPLQGREKASYSIGDRVRHKAFGEGMVLSVSPMGNDTLLEIAFETRGTKKLMANFAKLEKL